jgi:hypothetical protein
MSAKLEQPELWHLATRRTEAIQPAYLAESLQYRPKLMNG